jgi:hypothetical protein
MSNTLLLNRIISEFRNTSRPSKKKKDVSVPKVQPVPTHAVESDEEIFDSVFSSFEEGVKPWYLRGRAQALDGLVLSGKTMNELIRLQQTLVENRELNRPTVAVFSGPTGCGKSSAAHVISESVSWLLPMEDFQASEIHNHFETGVCRSFFNKTRQRPSVLVSDVDNSEYGSELKNHVDILRGSGLLIVECNDEFCTFMKSLMKTKQPFSVIRFSRLDEYAFGRACFNSIHVIDRSIPLPSVSIIEQIYSVCLGDVRSGLVRLEMLWSSGGLRSWPETLGELDASLSKMDHFKNTFEKVKMMCAAEDMDNFVDRAHTLVESNDFTVRVVSENVEKILDARGVGQDMDVCARMCEQISNSQNILAGCRDTKMATMTGCIQPLHTILSRTRCEKPVFPKMPSLLNAAKQESENRNPLKYMTNGDSMTVYGHGGVSFKSQSISLPDGVLSGGLPLCLCEWIHLQHQAGLKEKQIVLPRDIMLCLGQMLKPSQKRSKRRAVNKLEQMISTYICKNES